MIVEQFKDSQQRDCVIVHLKSQEVIVVRGDGKVETYRDMKHYMAGKFEQSSVIVPELD